MGHVTLGIVCGLKSEAACLPRSPRLLVGISGANAERAETEARRLAITGVDALVSFGLAGALDPALRTGDLVIPQAVLSPSGETYRTTPIAGTASQRPTTLLGSETIVGTAEEKARLRRLTGADAVDMETHRVASVAAEIGLPFFVVRAIADDATGAVPKAALGAVTADGGVRVGATLAGLLSRPQDLPRLIALGRESSRATGRLRQAAPSLLRL